MSENTEASGTKAPALSAADIQMLFTLASSSVKSVKWGDIATALNPDSPEKNSTLSMRWIRLKTKLEKHYGVDVKAPETPKKTGNDAGEGQAGAVKTPKTPTKGADGAGDAPSTKKASVKKTPVKTTDGAGEAPAIKKRGRGRPSKVSKDKELEEAAATEQLDESSPSKKPKLDNKAEGSDDLEVKQVQ